jgi:hypothetical protein
VTSAVRIEQAGSRPLAVVRLTAKPSELSRVVPETMGVVWKILREAEIHGGRNVAVYLDGAILGARSYWRSLVLFQPERVHRRN